LVGISIQVKIHKSQPNIYTLFWCFDLITRRSWYSVILSLDATISCHIKKAVVGVTQLITALISIHSSMTLLADMYSFLDPPSLWPTTAFLMRQLIVASRLGRI